jgi:hypothetical protein
MRKIELIGKRYDRLVVTTEGPESPSGARRVYCDCDCGKTRCLVCASELRRGRKKSCGCISARIKHGHAARGLKTRLYFSWRAMFRRCDDTENKDYRHVEICERWRSFENFANDMGDRPFPGATLDRIDNSLGYFPGNVRWADRHTQSRNRTDNVFAEWDGRRLCLADWADSLGVSRGTMTYRYRKWGVDARTFHQGPIPRAEHTST